jgi:hypothetical protein
VPDGARLRVVLREAELMTEPSPMLEERMTPVKLVLVSL